MITTKNDLYQGTRTYIEQQVKKDQPINKLITKVSNKFCIDERTAKQWIELCR